MPLDHLVPFSLAAVRPAAWEPVGGAAGLTMVGLGVGMAATGGREK